MAEIKDEIKELLLKREKVSKDELIQQFNITKRYVELIIKELNEELMKEGYKILREGRKPVIYRLIKINKPELRSDINSLDKFIETIKGFVRSDETYKMFIVPPMFPKEELINRMIREGFKLFNLKIDHKSSSNGLPMLRYIMYFEHNQSMCGITAFIGTEDTVTQYNVACWKVN